MAPRQSYSKSANLYEPCVECQKKRTLCVRVRRAHNLGHAALSVHEPLAAGGEKVTTYGFWPAQAGKPRWDTNVRKNDPGDVYSNTQDWDPKDVQCKEIDEKQEEKLKAAVNKNAQYNLLSGDWCSTWAAGTYNGVTGSNLGGFLPSSLGNSINPPPELGPMP
ncbi:MAG: hypothetical protein R3B70_01730 [Polyangiaceae bacterium]